MRSRSAIRHDRSRNSTCPPYDFEIPSTLITRPGYPMPCTDSGLIFTVTRTSPGARLG
jgi:hypothetical protein